MRPTLIAHRDAVISLIAKTAIVNQRLLIAIAGPPGSGKSTLAEAVVAELNSALDETEPLAALLPMDGFHLDNAILEQRGLLARKGAPETFDANGLIELLTRVKTETGDVRYPLFDRAADRSLVDAGLLRAGTRVVVVEGNYLLLKDSPWSTLAGLFDTSVFLAPSLATLDSRLMARWLDHGFSIDQALQKTQNNDLVNADYVLHHSREADLKLAGSELLGAPSNQAGTLRFDDR